MIQPDPISETELEELASFLERNFDQGGMDVSMLDGLLCALALGPKRLDPSEWLPFVWSDDGDEPRLDNIEQFERIVSLLMRYYDAVVHDTREGLFVPLLPDSVLPDAENRAQPWCLGFLVGVSFDEGWQQLLGNEEGAMIGLPIFALADPGQFGGDSAPDPKATDELIALLPQAVVMIQLYWLDSKRPAVRRRTSSRSAIRSSKRREPDEPQRNGHGTVHRLKIRLLEVKPPVWRRVEIASDAKLPDVSRALLAAMGWNDSHLHGFRAKGTSYGIPDPGFPRGERDERRVTLAQLAPQPKDHFVFDYDFGDGWEHRVTIEAIVTVDPQATYPRCLAGRRACPPEDCGGPWGYEELLRQLADPSDEEHEAMLEWVGPVDPEAFSLDEVNRELATLVPRPRRNSAAVVDRKDVTLQTDRDDDDMLREYDFSNAPQANAAGAKLSERELIA